MPLLSMQAAAVQRARAVVQHHSRSVLQHQCRFHLLQFRETFMGALMLFAMLFCHPTMHQSDEMCLTLLPLPVQIASRPVSRPGKVPLEKGYSQMDWLRLSRSSPDLAGQCSLHHLSTPACQCSAMAHLVLTHTPSEDYKWCRTERAAVAKRHNTGGGEGASEKG